MSDHRHNILNAAHDAIGGKRNQTYGSVSANFQRAAAIATALVGQPISAHQIGLIQIAVKLSRICETPTHRDSHVDIAGYAACAYEAAMSDPLLASSADEMVRSALRHSDGLTIEELEDDTGLEPEVLSETLGQMGNFAIHMNGNIYTLKEWHDAAGDTET